MLKEIYGVNPDWYLRTISGPWETIDNEQFATCIENGVLYIFFQKTVGGLDWLSNLNFLPTKEHAPAKAYPEMSQPWYCHRGFMEAFKKLESELAYRVNYFLDPAYVNFVRIQGYSRGAALAQLCAEWLKYNRSDCIVDTIAFAPPRLIWWPLSWNVRARLWNTQLVIDEGDLITHVPPAWWGYTHIGQKIIISKKDQFTLTTEEHRETNYLKRLEEYVA